VEDVDEVELDGGRAAAAEWKMPILAISEHIEHEECVHLCSLSDSTYKIPRCILGCLYTQLVSRAKHTQ
jgi:hypothetical protein